MGLSSRYSQLENGQHGRRQSAATQARVPSGAREAALSLRPAAPTGIFSNNNSEQNAEHTHLLLAFLRVVGSGA